MTHEDLKEMTKDALKTGAPYVYLYPEEAEDLVKEFEEAKLAAMATKQKK